MIKIIMIFVAALMFAVVIAAPILLMVAGWVQSMRHKTAVESAERA